MQTERVTRSRARTLAATGETPALAALPDKTPATRAGVRRRAAAAATAPPAASAAPAAAAEAVQPVVLFDVTNDQDGAAPATIAVTAVIPEEPAAPEAAAEAPPAPAAEASADTAAPAAEHSADEPPATPAHARASPAPVAPSATPTGLGLSTLLPQSPLAATLPAATPAATPLGGAPADGGRVAQALHAAVAALGGAPASPMAASPAAASPAPQADSLVFRGFGSPLKQEEADSPAAVPVSIGAAVRPAGEPAAAPSPAQGLDFQVEEREITLEEMMGTPFPSDRAETPDGPTPTLQAPPASAARPAARTHAAAAAPTGATPVVVRTAAKVHPLTPSRQVVLEAEEQDYVMHVEGAAEQAGDADMAAAEEASPSPMAARAPVPAAQPRVQSKVVVPSPHSYDPRSLRQLRREVSDRLAAKQAAAPAGLEEDWGKDEDEEGGYIAAAPGGEELADALGGLSLETGAHGPLRGLPTPAGTHIRFDDDGEGEESPRQRVFLRGLPVPEGTHIHFD